jgi:hypothetical protein
MKAARSVKAARTAMATRAASVAMKEERVTLVWVEETSVF